MDKITRALASGNYKKALSLLQRLKRKDAQYNVQASYYRVLCHFHLSQYLQAANIGKEIVNDVPNKQMKLDLLWMIANSKLKLNRLEETETALLQSLALDDTVNNVKARQLLCEVSLARESYELIEEYAPKLLSYEQSDLPAATILIYSAIGQSNKKLALARITKLISAQKDMSVDNIVFLADSLISMSEYEAGASLLEKYNTLYGNEFWYQLLVAWLTFESGDAECAEKIVRDREASDLPDWFKSKALVYEIKGKIYEKQKAFALSFANYKKMAKYIKNKYQSYQKVNYLSAYKKLDLSSLNLDTKEAGKYRLAFMVGFPRSGTTLLETILDAHPEIETLSEQPTITNVIKQIEEHFKTKNYISKLANLTPELISQLREVYFKTAAKHVALDTDKVIIDKMPLNTMHLPLIKVLFPESKIIFSLRHPLDVVLSNFQQNFVINNEMAFLITLEDCVSRYVEVMGFSEDVKARLKTDWFTIKYEDLVVDKEQVCHELFDYLNVTSEFEIDSYLSHAQNKVINTASRNQVTKTMYDRSRLKWKNYKEELEEARVKLAPFISKYGYDER